MINLLPPSAKEDKRYAKLNTILVRYVWLLVFIILGLGFMFGATEVYMSNQRSTLNKDIAATNQQITGFKDLQDKAKNANARLKAFKGLVTNQAKFSDLLTDLANHTPKGVFINSITLNGNTSTAVQVAATANSYQSAAGFRDALASSSRVKDAAIDNISNPSAGVYTVTVSIAFKTGAFK